jgi:hypothetical protein
LSLSHFPQRRATCQPIGRRQAQKGSSANAQFVCWTRSLAMVGAANKLMMNIMTGLRSGEASANLAARRLPSCLGFLSLTRITA